LGIIPYLLITYLWIGVTHMRLTPYIVFIAMGFVLGVLTIPNATLNVTLDNCMTDTECESLDNTQGKGY
jgi:hypothetical protein